MQALQHPEAWLPVDMAAAAARWQYTFTDDDIAELTQALRDIQASNKLVPNFGKDDFPVAA